MDARNLISSLRSTFILLSPFTSPIPPILASQTGRRREPEGSAERGSRPGLRREWERIRDERREGKSDPTVLRYDDWR